MTPRTHTSSGNAARRLSPMASPISGTDQVGSPGSSHNVGADCVGPPYGGGAEVGRLTTPPTLARGCDRKAR